MDTIKMNENLNIAIERVKKLNDPLLVIGLGGTGTDVVASIKKMFAERYELPTDENGNKIPVPRRTDYLVIDSDKKSLSEFPAHEALNISMAGMEAILKPGAREARLKPYEQSWLNPQFSAASSGLGAGTYRQAARLMLSRNYDSVFSTIKSKLETLTSVVSGAADGGIMRVNVVIVTGICGGTGSGTFLDVAQIVRHCLATEKLSLLKSKITGYIVMPDISCAHVNAGGEAMQNILKANGYAALKELDFWMRVGEHKTAYTAQYTANLGSAVTWDMPPFDACILMSGVSAQGELFRDGYGVVRRTIAENLLHYLADESGSDRSQGSDDDEYSYISYEDNLNAIAKGIAKSTPLYYGYRAAGAYTKRIPKQDVMFYEGNKLLTTFVPPRDPNGNLVPNKALCTDGKNVPRANAIVGDVGDLQKNAATHVALPAFLNMPVEALQHMMPAPHERANFADPTRWETDVVPPAMNKLAESYLQTAWSRFEKFARSVITDPQQGPFSLMAYLKQEGETGLMHALKGLEQDWESKRNNLVSKRPAMKKVCEDAYPSFVRPPMLSKQHALDAYIDAVKRYYAQVRAMAFLDAFIPALHKLVLRVNEYITFSLSKMCDDIEAYHQMFGETSTEDAKIVTNIYDLNDVKDGIDRDYIEKNIDFKYERELLGQLCNASFETMPNVDPHASGVTFLYDQKHLDVLYNALREVLQECFGDVNNESLDAIMVQQVGEDIGRQNNYMDDLCQTLLNSSVPLFAQNPAYLDEPVAKYSYLSVPSDAQKFLNRYETILTDEMMPKPSEIRDHMYCVTSWDGLPLYRYAMMESLVSAYSEMLGNRDTSMGIHLVFHPDERNYRSNWSLLPEPCPHYLFGQPGTVREKNEYQQLRECVMRAIKCGIVVVDDSVQKPTYEVRLRYADAGKVTFKSADTVKEEVDNLAEERDPITKTPIQPEILESRLDDYLNTSQEITTIVLKPNCSPAVMAGTLGVDFNKVDPWNSDVAADSRQLNEAKRSYRVLSEELAVAVLSRYPMYMLGIQMQLEAIEYAKAKRDALAKQKLLWGPRKDYAPTFAKLYMHGIVQPGVHSYLFVDVTGQKNPLIQEQLLSADIENDSPVFKNCAYLADLDETHAVRTELGSLLAEKEKALEDKEMSGALKAADLEGLIQMGESLVRSCDADSKAYQAKLHTPGVDRQRIEKIIGVYQAIMDTTNSLLGAYQGVLPTLK